MSLVLPSMEVAEGPTVGFKGQGTSAASYVGVPVYLRVAGDEWNVAGKNEGKTLLWRNGLALDGQKGGPLVMAEEQEEKDADSAESSSIGAGGDSSLSLSSSTADDGGDGEEEVQSKAKKDALGTLESLEECLPIKRGLSNCFSGKSKSFANLSDAATLGSAGDLAKVENPFNKRRRILMACKASWQRRASYAALNTSKLWALEEDQEYDDGGKSGGGDVSESPSQSPLSTGRKYIKTFKSAKSFSLTDLQQA